MRGFRPFSSHVTKCHACHGICTLSPLRAALTMRFAQNTQQDTSKVLRLPATQIDIGGSQSAAHATKNETHLLKRSPKYCACHAKRLLTRLEKCGNVMKYHACHAKRRYAKMENSKHDPFCRTYDRHGHTALARTVANGCGRLRTVANA